jgi:[ribosomal protein S18]-alanine N-acetyltransferase
MTEKKLKIDYMTSGDLLKVIDVEKACFTDPWSYSIFLGDLESEETITLVARLNKKVVGFALCMQVVDELHLTNIAVHPDFQRKKVGHQLIERLFYIGERNDCSIMYLDVRRSNTQAITFYKGYGFDILYERKGYYRNPPEDALVMVLRLSERLKSGVV